MRLTPNFTLEELACRDGTSVPTEYLENARRICERAQVLRTFLGSPITVTSGYRTLVHNTKVGGAKTSLHVTASALDLKCGEAGDWSPLEIAKTYQGLINIGRVPDGGLGVYERPNGGWIHIDLGRPRRWRG